MKRICNELEINLPFGNSLNEVILHEDIIDILFKHKNEIYHKLTDLRNAYLIDHISIKIMDPKGKLIIFSMTPSVEYNLIVQNLWMFDNSFSSSFQKKNIFYSWDKAYKREYFDILKNTKQLKHGFTYGFNISKEINSFKLIYSYATRSENEGIQAYYYDRKIELSRLGDYGYKLIFNIYEEYCDGEFNPPLISHVNSFSKKNPYN